MGQTQLGGVGLLERCAFRVGTEPQPSHPESPRGTRSLPKPHTTTTAAPYLLYGLDDVERVDDEPAQRPGQAARPERRRLLSEPRPASPQPPSPRRRRRREGGRGPHQTLLHALVRREVESEGRGISESGDGGPAEECANSLRLDELRRAVHGAPVLDAARAGGADLDLRRETARGERRIHGLRALCWFKVNHGGGVCGIKRPSVVRCGGASSQKTSHQQE